MPLKRCTSNGKNGWKWGDEGKCYTGPGAKKKAIDQGIAIEGPEKFKKMAAEDPELSMADALDSLGIVTGFVHNSTLAINEPGWASTNKSQLPRLAFAEMGEPNKNSTWEFPHHWVQAGGNPDKTGVVTTGTLYLHKAGLRRAWSTANGAQSGYNVSNEVKAHLRRHMAAIGETKQDTAAFYGVTLAQLEELDASLIAAALLTRRDLEVNPGDDLSRWLVQE